MAQTLSAASWSEYKKKRNLQADDAPLVKALATFDKTDKAKPKPRLAALEDVVEQIKKQIAALAKRKKELGDKPFNEAKDKLYALLGAAEGLQKATAADAARSIADEEEDEPDTPALLSTKMVPLLAKLKSANGAVRMSALICTAGKNTAVLIMAATISESRRKLLADAVDAAGGAKYIAGECLYENDALTFVVKASGGGLAARLHRAILSQTGKKLKVRVRGEDGVLDVDGEDDQTEGPSSGPGEAVPDPAPRPSDGPCLDPGNAFKARLGALIPNVKLVTAGIVPSAQDIKLKASEAGVMARKMDFQSAHALLDAVEKMIADALASVPGTGERAPSGPSTADGSSASPASDAVGGMAEWKARRAAAVSSLKAVAAEIAGAKHASSAKAIIELQAVIKNLTAEPTTVQQVTELQNWLASDDVVNDVCELAEDIRTPLLGALTRLRSTMAA